VSYIQCALSLKQKVWKVWSKSSRRRDNTNEERKIFTRGLSATKCPLAPSRYFCQRSSERYYHSGRLSNLLCLLRHTLLSKHSEVVKYINSSVVRWSSDTSTNIDSRIGYSSIQAEIQSWQQRLYYVLEYVKALVVADSHILISGKIWQHSHNSLTAQDSRNAQQSNLCISYVLVFFDRSIPSTVCKKWKFSCLSVRSREVPAEDLVSRTMASGDGSMEYIISRIIRSAADIETPIFPGIS